MAADHITLNGVIFGTGGSHNGPTNIEEDPEGFGSELTARNGALTTLQTGIKWRWTLTWDGIPKTTRDAIKAIALLSSTFTYVDQDGGSFTVQCPLKGRYKSGISIIGESGTLYYGITLVFWES